MNRLFVLKDVAYAAKTGGTVADIGEVGELLPGAMAFFTERGVLLTAANVDVTIPNVKNIIAAVGMADDGSGVDNTQILNIPRRAITDVSRVSYRAYTRPVMTIGGTTSATAINIAAAAVGELYVKVQNVSFTSRNLTAQKAASFTKRTGTTVEAAIDGLIVNLNTDNLLFTAAKVGTSPNFGITITPLQDDVTLDATVGSLLDGTNVSVTTTGIRGVGVGSDVRIMESDFSIEMGNGNFIDYTPEWYSRELEASMTGTYHLLTLTWTGMHDQPTGQNPVMFNRLIIAPLSTATAGATNQNVLTFRTLLQSIVGQSYSGTLGTETGNSDGTDYDGVAGN